MFEYSAVLGNDLRTMWSGEILPFLDMMRNSPYFWPGLVAAGVVIMLLARSFTR
jgi:hypothetical protein